MSAPGKKQALACLLQRTGVSRVLLAAQRRIYGPYIRAVNYHSTPENCRDNLQRHLEFYRRHFCPVGYQDLLDLQQGRWGKPKPGLIISFDDGLRNNAEVAAPLLEEFGFVGWFFVPVGFLDASEEEQLAFIRGRRISPTFRQAHAPGRQAISWEQLRELVDRHVIGCHTQNHTHLTAGLSRQELEREIILPKRWLEQMLGRKVDAFCWVGGEESSYSSAAADMIRQAGYRVSFMTNSSPIRPHSNLLQLQRTNIEADWPIDVVRLQLCGLLDLLYAAKRRRINHLTAFG